MQKITIVKNNETPFLASDGSEFIKEDLTAANDFKTIFWLGGFQY